MNIQELINKLTKIKSECGDLMVGVRGQLPIDSCATEEYTRIASSVTVERYHEKSDALVVIVL